jgi:hypothetical protein
MLKNAKHHRTDLAIDAYGATAAGNATRHAHKTAIRNCGSALIEQLEDRTALSAMSFGPAADRLLQVATATALAKEPGSQASGCKASDRNIQYGSARVSVGHDVNDQIREAIKIGDINRNRGLRCNIDFPCDVDMYWFKVRAGQRIAFDIDRPAGSNLDSYIRVFNARGIEIASNDDGTEPGQAPSQDSYMEVNFRCGGTFYIGVSGYGNAHYSPLTGTGDSNGSTGQYDLWLLPLRSPRPTPPQPNPNPTPPPAPTDWFSANLRDTGIIQAARSAFSDRSISRSEMMTILRAAGSDDGWVDSTELADLRTLVNNWYILGMPDYVRCLASSIVNSNPANARYQGSGLGDLRAGSSSTQLEQLIGKWFLGNDHPVAEGKNGELYSYRFANGSLFVGGVSYTDIVQGNVGDCYYLAALGSAAARSPSSIQNMFIDNGDGTYTVRFYNSGTAEYATVDRYLPVDGSGRLVFASTGKLVADNGNELWVALAEKAYAQMDEAGWIGQDGTNRYQGISGGWSSTAINQITVKSTNVDASISSGDFSAFVNAIQAGRMVGINTTDHAYAVIGYDGWDSTFTIYDPWGTTSSYSWSAVVSTFANWWTTTT